MVNRKQITFISPCDDDDDDDILNKCNSQWVIRFAEVSMVLLLVIKLVLTCSPTLYKTSYHWRRARIKSKLLSGIFCVTQKTYWIYTERKGFATFMNRVWANANIQKCNEQFRCCSYQSWTNCSIYEIFRRCNENKFFF